MADEGPRDTDAEREAAPSLELPSLRSALGLGRKRRRRTAAETPPEARPPAPTAVPEPESDHSLGAMETSESATEQSAQPATTAVPDQAGPVVSPGPVGLPEAIPEHPVKADPSTAVLPETRPDLAAPEAAAQEAPARRRASRRPLDLHLPGPLVALLVGAVAGLALVGLTTAGRQACSAVRGTSSCGTPGILLLLAATVLTVLLGSLLLKLAGVDSAGSTSFLGVGLLVVVILLALLPVIYQWWMVIVVPAVAMATYAAAWWLTTTYVEPGERAR